MAFNWPKQPRVVGTKIKRLDGPFKTPGRSRPLTGRWRRERLNLAIEAGGGDGWPFSIQARDPGPLIPGPRPAQG